MLFIDFESQTPFQISAHPPPSTGDETWKVICAVRSGGSESGAIAEMIFVQNL